MIRDDRKLDEGPAQRFEEDAAMLDAWTIKDFDDLTDRANGSVRCSLSVGEEPYGG